MKSQRLQKSYLLEGDVTIEEQALAKRDGFGVWDSESIHIKADSAAKILLMEVPMELNLN